MVKRVEQPADRGVGDRDRPVEVGEILPDVGGIGQIVGHHDVVGVGGFVAVARIWPVRFEEARGEQERLLGRIGEPAGGVLDDVFAVGVRHVEFVEAELRRVRRLVLHTE